jgi:hypothetical protein
MAGECDKCGDHTLDCKCTKLIFNKPPDDSIDVYITMGSFYKINQYVDFLPTHLYASSEPAACKELGKIVILGGPTLIFHLKRQEIPIETHEELLRHRPVP